LSVAIVQAQSTSATLSGTVTDENGAVVPGANVTVTNPATGLQRQATTSGDGSFSIPLLPPSTYTVLVERQGFATAKLSDLVLNVNANVALTIELKVGQIGGDTVNVNDLSLVETSPSVGTVIDRQFVGNLPLNGRSFQSLITLTPGVVLGTTSTTSQGQFSVNGQRTNSNYFSVDGVSANVGVSSGDFIGQQAAGSIPGLSTAGGTNSLISVDALQEFKIQTSTYAPEYGRTSGAQISLVSRSGTSDFHGTIFEYYRNEKLDANDYFANRAGLPRARLRQNQFGGVFSGPIMLPRFGEGGKSFYDGRKNSFFFFSYEGLRLTQPQTAVTTVPATRVRELAPANLKFLLNAFPLPTGPEIGVTGRSPFTGTYSDRSRLNATSLRIDHSFSDRLTLFGRFNVAPSESTTRLSRTPNLLTNIDLKTQTLTLGSTLSFNTQTLNEIRFNYSRTSGARSSVLDNYGGASPVTTAQLVPDFVQGLNVSSTIQFYSGFFSIGRFNDNLQRQINVVDNLSHIRGAHNFKIGIDYRRLSPLFRARDYQLSCSFSNEATVLAGNVSNCQVVGIKSSQPIFNNLSAYFQDNWQASRRLTLTYGVRWDVNPAPKEANGNSAFVLNTSDPLTASLAPPGTPLWKTTYDNFAPRFGLSYQVSQRPGHELVLRGGIGVFYDLGNTQGGDAYTHGAFQTKFNTFFNVPYPLTPAQAALPPFPTDATGATIFGFDPHLKLPYTWQWNFTIERSLGTAQTLSAAYVAAISRRLLRQQFFLLLPNFRSLQYFDNASTSDYHSLQLQFTRRLSNNFQALASYTWSHAIDDLSYETESGILRRGNADFDIRHNFSAAFQYNSPWKPTGFAGLLLRDWQTDLIIHAQSAYPLTPFTTQFGILDSRLVTFVPDAVEGVPFYVSDPLAPGGRRINAAAFKQPAPNTKGNFGRNILRGFPIYQFDMALQRLFSIRENVKLTLRGEAFNIFNHPNFALPSADLTSPLFGQPTQMLGRGLGGISPIYQIGGPRSIQLSVKLNF
jgi:hypothetical protein